MKLIIKFNLILITVFAIGVAIASFLSYKITTESAYSQVKDQASLMLQQQFAVRRYTLNDVRPKLYQLEKGDTFHPQTIPAYSVRKVSENLQKVRPNFNVRTAALNPTNLNNKAADWEEDIIERFLADSNLKEQEGEITLNGKKLFYIATPIAIKDPNCLTCHSTPEAAPASMLTQYGSENGFGWELNEVIGTRIITVPLTLPLALAKKSFWSFFTSMLGVFFMLFVVLNILLHKMIIKPIVNITKVADKVSHGHLDVELIKEKGKDEISSLVASFNRMVRSTELMAKMIQKIKAKNKKH